MAQSSVRDILADVLERNRSLVATTNLGQTPKASRQTFSNA